MKLIQHSPESDTWFTESGNHYIERGYDIDGLCTSFEVYGEGTADVHEEGSSFRISEYDSPEKAFKAAKNYLENLLKELKP